MSIEEKHWQGLYLHSKGVDQQDPAWGTIALTTSSSGKVSSRTSSKANVWNNGMLNFWDDFSEDGMLSERKLSADEDPMASLAVKKTIAPKQTETFVFYLTWNFPNRKGWSKSIVGNYYSQQYRDAWDVAGFPSEL